MTLGDNRLNENVVNHHYNELNQLMQTLTFREGYPEENLLEEYPVAIRLGIDIQDETLCVIDLF